MNHQSILRLTSAIYGDALYTDLLIHVNNSHEVISINGALCAVVDTWGTDKTPAIIKFYTVDETIDQSDGHPVIEADRIDTDPIKARMIKLRKVLSAFMLRDRYLVIDCKNYNYYGFEWELGENDALAQLRESITTPVSLVGRSGGHLQLDLHRFESTRLDMADVLTALSNDYADLEDGDYDALIADLNTITQDVVAYKTWVSDDDDDA
jgi:hypothetical protein